MEIRDPRNGMTMEALVGCTINNGEAPHEIQDKNTRSLLLPLPPCTRWRVKPLPIGMRMESPPYGISRTLTFWYEDEVTTLWKVGSVSDFVWSDTPLEFLGSVNQLSFEDESCLPIKGHVLTNEETAEYENMQREGKARVSLSGKSPEEIRGLPLDVGKGGGAKVLPFEFRALEMCLESACKCLEAEE